MAGTTVWDEVLRVVAADLDAEEFRRWFSATSYASDSGDQITVWVPSAAIGRHLETHYDDEIRTALTALGRPDTLIRFVNAGFGDEDEDDEDS
jgi:chromosomal replication initiation ATPase DnaA